MMSIYLENSSPENHIKYAITNLSKYNLLDKGNHYNLLY